jgi:hypothetical protein
VEGEAAPARPYTESTGNTLPGLLAPSFLNGFVTGKSARHRFPSRAIARYGFEYRRKVEYGGAGYNIDFKQHLSPCGVTIPSGRVKELTLWEAVASR